MQHVAGRSTWIVTAGGEDPPPAVEAVQLKLEPDAGRASRGPVSSVSGKNGGLGPIRTGITLF